MCNSEVADLMIMWVDGTSVGKCVECEGVMIGRSYEEPIEGSHYRVLDGMLVDENGDMVPRTKTRWQWRHEGEEYRGELPGPSTTDANARLKELLKAVV